MDGGTTESTGGGRRAFVEGLGSLEGWWNASGIALWSFVLFGAFLLNATLLLAFIKRPGLRTISNRFVMNLTVSNLLTCAILNPLLMLDGHSSSGTTSTACSIAESATAMVTSSSVLSVLLIAIDQYLAVVDPLRYRTRIDKLKCVILVISMWLVSLIFAILAGFNPSPQSPWLLCAKRENLTSHGIVNYTRNETLNFTIDASLRIIVNTTENYDLDGDITFTEFDENLTFYENTSQLMAKTYRRDFVNISIGKNITEISYDKFSITYGLVYAISYAILAYLVPFIGVCWIYASIYSAAHKNSERTRRTGSRPILSSASFSEEYCPVRQEASSEDFRRIPKISSLSSIDESIETHTPSQTILPRINGSEFLSNTSEQQQHQHQTRNTTIDEEEPIIVVFTVGSSKVDVTPQQQQQQSDKSIIVKRTNDDKTKDMINDKKVPTAILKAQFLDNKTSDNLPRDNDVTARSKFRDEPQQKRKSSHDLMYEEMLRDDLEKLRLRDRSNDNLSTDDDDDDDVNDDDDDDDDEKVYDDDTRINNENFTISHRNVVNDEICHSVNDTIVDKELVTNERDAILDIDCETTASTSDVPEPIIIDNFITTTIKTTNNDSTSRKNSLDDSITNIPLQSSILKSQHCLSNGKFNSRNITNFQQRNDNSQINVNKDDNFYAKSSVGNLDTNLFGVTANNTPIVTITPPNKTSLQRVSSVRSTTSYINSLKHRISNGSLFKYREETRAARISALVMVMGLICWTPYVIVLLLKNIIPITGKNVNHEIDVAAMSFIILATYVSPLLFGYRSRRVKRELRKLFCFRRELSYKNNRSLMAKKVLKRRQSGHMSQLEMDARYNIFNCVYGRTRWPKDKVHFVQVPETALAVETCRSSFSSGASTQISSTSTEEC